MNLTVEIHEKEWPSIVAGAKKARTTPERYVQRLFNAGFDARHPEAWGNKPFDDEQTLIALACAGLPDIVRVSSAVGCPPERLERILGAWDHVVAITPRVRLEEAQTLPKATHYTQTTQDPAPEGIGYSVSTSVAGTETDALRNEASHARHDASCNNSDERAGSSENVGAEPILAKHKIPDSASSSAAGDVPAMAKSSASEPAVGALTPDAEDIETDVVFSGDTFAALREIAAEEAPEGLLTDDEMQTFIAFAVSIAKTWPERFPVSGVANRKLIEKEAGDKFEYLTPAFRAIQKAGLVSLQPQAFSPASYFGFRVTPEGAAVILDALGNGD